jgi:hypothetical protein
VIRGVNVGKLISSTWSTRSGDVAMVSDSARCGPDVTRAQTPREAGSRISLEPPQSVIWLWRWRSSQQAMTMKPDDYQRNPMPQLPIKHPRRLRLQRQYS